MTNLNLYSLIRTFDRTRYNRPPDSGAFEGYDKQGLLSTLKAYIFLRQSNFSKALKRQFYFASLIFLGIPWIANAFSFVQISSNALSILVFAIAMVYCIGLLAYNMANAPPRFAYRLFGELCSSEDILFLAWVTCSKEGALRTYLVKDLLKKFQESLRVYKSLDHTEVEWSPGDTMALCKWIHIDRYRRYEDIQINVLAVLERHGNRLIAYEYLKKFRKHPLWFTVSTPVKDAIQEFIDYERNQV